ncbi:ABC transporter ATP-binding protein [Microtetraspora niveoalba]|uniref:ABC transporter ATP-binding protein n=1 Tax=Microtetraspora niveoalba TaxID=46175 RepID=UPI000ABDE600|nr:ATP-binding cassette domain-containing protein [Microtetraspora niveoalba]
MTPDPVRPDPAMPGPATTDTVTTDTVTTDTAMTNTVPADTAMTDTSTPDSVTTGTLTSDAVAPHPATTVPVTGDAVTGDAVTGDAVTGDAAAPRAVRCRGLRYSFGRTRAVDGVDLTVASGEVFGLLGPNGAGKTTAIRCLTTLLPVPPGTVRVFGHDAARERMAVRRMIGYVPQQLSADASLTGRENVALFARLFDVRRRERAERVALALEAVGLADAADRMAGTYSGGMVRRLELAQALVSAPRLLMLDEPTIGLDPIARTAVWEHITAIRAATGMTVLVTTHYMDEADQYCDRVALMHAGRVQALGTPERLKAALRDRRGDGAAPTLEDVFRDVVGGDLGAGEEGGDFRDVRRTRRTASRLG